MTKRITDEAGRGETETLPCRCIPDAVFFGGMAISDQLLQPVWFDPTTSPGQRGIIGMAVFWCDCTTSAASARRWKEPVKWHPSLCCHLPELAQEIILQRLLLTPVEILYEGEALE